jgi:hypothetical protein
MFHRIGKALAFAAALAWTLSAQQAIVNMPSADITPQGKNFFMHETQWRFWKPGTYWYGTHFYCYGVGKSTELALTSYNAGSPATANFTTGVGFKSAPQLWAKSHPEREVKLTFGQMGLVNHRAQGLGSFSYAHLSLRLPKANTRLTVGGWGGTKQLFKKNTANVLAGLEQTLDKKGKWVWVNEWFAGRHDLGFYITGFLYHPTKRHIFVAAYKVPNFLANGRHGLVLEYGLFF